MTRFSYDAVLKSGMFSESLRTWRRKPVDQKTWANFQTFMAVQYEDYLEDQTADEQLPYAGSAVQEETLAALQNVVETLTNDRADIAILSEANSASITANSILEGQVKDQLAQIKALTIRIEKLERKPGTPRTEHVRGSTGGRKRHKKYCFTCGVQRDHGSCDCRVGISVHKADATCTDRKGGSNVDQTRE